MDSADPLHAEILAVLRDARFLPLRSTCGATVIADVLARWLCRPTKNREGAAYLAEELRKRVAAARLEN